MLAGDVDAFPDFPAPEHVAQFQADPRFKVDRRHRPRARRFSAMNNGKPPFDNVKVREAIAHAIDRKAIIDGALFGYGTPIGTLLSPRNPAYVDLTGVYPHDPTKSKALLAEAGWRTASRPR